MAKPTEMMDPFPDSSLVPVVGYQRRPRPSEGPPGARVFGRIPMTSSDSIGYVSCAGRHENSITPAARTIGCQS